jgi:uncharacterized membrane protein HdeD (DUF308 family)
MEFTLARRWGAVALRGILAIIIGIIAFFWPGLFWLAVVYTFAIYAILDGIVALYLALTGHGPQPWWALVLEGVVSIAAGIIALVWPGITELALLFVIAGWAIATGIFAIIAAIRLRRHIPHEWLLALSGILSVILGLALALVPAAGLLVVALWVGAYFIVVGVMLLALSFRLRAAAAQRGRPAPTSPSR